MDVFFECLEHRAEYICRYTDDERHIMAQKIQELLKNYEEELLPREIELVAVLYKWSIPSDQAVFFNQIERYALNGICGAAFTVAVCNFIWINSKVFSEWQKEKAMQILRHLEERTPPELLDTIEFTRNCFSANYEDHCDPHSKICLLIPEFASGLSFLQPPLGLMTSVSILKNHGIPADILDNRAWHYSEQQLYDKLKKYEVIVYNTTPIDQVQNYFVDYRYSLAVKIGKGIKTAYPQKTLVICGSHGTVRTDLVETEQFADVILRGEYDYFIPTVVDAIINNRELANIPNLSFRADDGYFRTEVCQSSQHPLLNDNVYPDYDSVDLEGYYGNAHYNGVNVKKRNWSIFMTSRGCPYRCIFCYKFFGNNVRQHTITHAIHELEIMRAHGVDSFFIIDQLFTYNRQYVIDLCEEMISHGMNFTWSCQTRIDRIDKEMLHIMRKAGCVGIWLGVESVTDEILKYNQKGTNSEQILECLHLMNESDIAFNVFFMLGMPGETKESLEAMYNFIIQNRLPCTKSIMVCTPRFGTQMYQMAESEHPNAFPDFASLNSYKGQICNQVSLDDIQALIKRLSAITDNK